MAAGAADVNLTIFSPSRVHKRVRTACPSGPQNSPSQVGPPAAPQRIRPFATGIDVPPGLILGGRIRSQTVCLLSSPLDDLCQVRSSYSHVDPRTRTTRVRSFGPIYRALLASKRPRARALLCSGAPQVASAGIGAMHSSWLSGRAEPSRDAEPQGRDASVPSWAILYGNRRFNFLGQV